MMNKPSQAKPSQAKHNTSFLKNLLFLSNVVVQFIGQFLIFLIIILLFFANNSFGELWTQLSPSGTPPAARFGHTAVYDTTDNTMVIFAGWDGSYYTDVWKLTLGNSPAWSKLNPSGGPPSGRNVHSAIYDPINKEMIIYGGWYPARSDIWKLSLDGSLSWTQLSPSGPSIGARGFHAAVYNSSDNSMIIFAGYDPLKNDVWKLSLGASPSWTQLSPSGTPPSARNSPTSIYNPSDNSMVVFGGNDGSFKNDIWKLSLGASPSWTQLSPSGTPPSARSDHRTIYNPIDNSMILFGGGQGTGYRLNDVWKLSLGDTPTWTQISPSGTLPVARRYHSTIYNSSDNSMIIFGGVDDGVFSNDVWKLEFSTTKITKDTTETTTVEANDGSKTKIVIPPGSLDRDVIVKVTRDTTITDGIAYNFKITDATTGNEVENFLKSVTITIYYTIMNGKVTNTDVDQSDAASKLSIYYYDRVKWNKQKSEIDTINKFLSISTTHASIYAIKSITDVSTYYGGEVVVTPNPFTPNNDGVNDSVSFYFDNPNNENTTIKIFRRDGLLVRTLENITSWDGKDDNGNNLDSGLYLWQLEIGGVVKKRGTVILAR